MIWLTWRQFRAQALSALAVLAALAIYLVILGLAIRHSYDTQIVGCDKTNSCDAATNQFHHLYDAQLGLVGALLIGVPAIIGTFWGAPMITRELETGTHRLVWNQSVTRTRWLAVKLAVIALVSLAITGLLSLLLTWAASPYDRLAGGRFGPLAFDSRNIVPLGYAVFAFVLGTTIGLLIRRTLPAMALTLVIFAVAQIVMPFAIRPHLISPVNATVKFAGAAMMDGADLSLTRTGAFISGYTIPGDQDAWVLSSQSELLNSDGRPVTPAQFESCATGVFPHDMACLGKQNLHFTTTYHPSSRYWPFQWVELSVFLAAALLLTGFGFWRIPRGLS
jgi:ABC-type transport system involved in multi-copper enzyme maturation permease subunit